MKLLIAFIIFLLFGFLTSYQMQINSRRGFVGENLCSNYEIGGPHCKYSYKSGFPFTYYEINQNIKFPSEDACFNYAGKCLTEKISTRQINIQLFIADVLILGLILVAIPFLVYGLIFSILKVPFRISWLVISIVLSIIFNIISLIPVAWFAIPILGFVAIILTGPFLSAVGVGSTNTLQIIEFLLLPLVFGTFIFYLIIWGIWKIRHKS